MKHRMTKQPFLARPPETEPIPQSQLRGFRTASGTTYELSRDQSRIRRISLYGNPNMRHDGDWLKMLRTPDIQVGSPVILVLEPLGEGAAATFRTTTTVEEVYW